MFRVPCPACGAEVKFVNRASVFAVCEYCQSTLVRHDLNVETLGKMAVLNDDWSPMQKGTEGRLHGAHFALVGRVKLQWERGTWNEWCMWFDDARQGWLSEAQGFYYLSFPLDSPPALPKREELESGNTVPIGGTTYVIDDIKEATCIYSEGELPFAAMPGRRSTSVDLTSPGRGFACIDYSDEGVALYLGEFQNFDELHFSNLRALDGW